MVLLLIAVAVVGCSGKSVKEDNPVFAAAPPRRSLTNAAATAAEPRFNATVRDGEIRRASLDTSSQPMLTGTSVVCEVNGTPVFVDDVLGTLRTMLESDPRLSDAQRQTVMREQISKRLPHYVEQEIVLHALRQKIPEERQEAIRASLEPAFQQVLAEIRKDRNLASEAELEAELAKEQMTIAQLRDAFMRVQLVKGYLQTLAEVSPNVERAELLEYYRAHREDFTTPERIRLRELTVLFDQHGGRSGAEQVMKTAVLQLQAGEPFATVASAMSDGLTAENGGDLGWIQRGTLSDQTLEAELFEMPAGTTTRVLTGSNRFELYRVTDHEPARTESFVDVQQEIEEVIRQQKSEAATRRVFEDLKAKSSVVMKLDGITAFPDEPSDVTPVASQSSGARH